MASSISSWSVAVKHGSVIAEARGQAPEDLHVGQRLALRRNDRLGALQPVLAVGGEDVVVLEVRARRQHDVAVQHGVGHRDLDADGEQILAAQPAPHPVLVRDAPRPRCGCR